MLEISKYHKNQHTKIYNSTLEFIKFIKKKISFENKIILDVGCGAGANTIYLAEKYPASYIIGVDYDKSLISFATKKAKNKKLDNCKFISSSIAKLSLKKLKLDKIDLILSFHFLSFANDWIYKNLDKLIKLKPSYLAHSSLFFDGEVEAKILIDDFSKSEFKGSYYNIYSTLRLKEFLKKKNFIDFTYEAMDVKKVLRKPKHKGMQSYTLKIHNKKKLLFSGPLNLPHGFFFCSYKL